MTAHEQREDYLAELRKQYRLRERGERIGEQSPENCGPLCAEHGGHPDGPFCVTEREQALNAILAVLEYADRIHALGLAPYVSVSIVGVTPEVLSDVAGTPGEQYLADGRLLRCVHAVSSSGVSVTFQRTDAGVSRSAS